MERTIYRLGAELLSVRQFMEKQPEQADLYHALQAMTSAVEVTGLRTRPPGNPDDRFIAEIALGLLCRGWPTLSSPLVEESLLNQIAPDIGITVEAGPGHEINWRLSAEHEEAAASIIEAIANALLPTDDGLHPRPNKTIWLQDSVTEMDFFQQVIGQTLGPLRACVEWQRPLESMADRPSLKSQVVNQRADFTLELGPTNVSREAVKLNLEIDGPVHLSLAQQRKDNERDAILHQAGWNLHRIPVAKLTSGWELPVQAEEISPLAQHPVYSARNNAPLTGSLDSVGWVARSLLLTPHAIARIQLGILLALRDGALGLNQSKWRLLIREREVPCARLAVTDLLQVLTQLCVLYSVDLSFELELAVVDELNFHAGEETQDLVLPEVDRIVLESARTTDFDLAIDVSVLCRATQQYQDERLDGNWLRMRTAPSSASADVLTWAAPREIPHPLGHEVALNYFLRYCFRKHSFRDGQRPIIERALRRQSVIGLLPTGAGKSLAFQLPALLSPGITLVIDPIKSLMQDQVDNLHEAGIDSAVTINSDQTPEEKAASEQLLKAGEMRFGFISPERLQIKGFRETLKEICDLTPVAFAVVDEAHCVSEWGHDFRTAYLNLGRHVRDFMKHHGEEPPIVALTGTASRAVLIDVQREIGIAAPEAIVEPDKFDRPELHYAIEKVPSGKKREALAKVLRELPDQLQSRGYPFEPEMMTTGEAGGILFCPHVNGAFGVFQLAKEVRSKSGWETQVGFYCGEAPTKSDIDEAIWPSIKAQTQRQFKYNELSLLAATSAFGMGIDKANIRYTVHLGAPQSVEALMQEMGRAGRDRNPAICQILFSDRIDSPEKDPIHKGISLEEAKRRKQNLLGGEDDAMRALFLHLKGYHGALREATDVTLFVHEVLQPIWEQAEGATDTGPVEASERKVAAFLKSQAQVRAVAAGLPTTRENDDSIEPLYDSTIACGLDRIVYRLALLGVATDYTVEYRGKFDRVYTITSSRISDETLIAHLHRYFLRYRRSDSLIDTEKQLRGAAGESVMERAIHVLCQFIYEEIEKQRREAIWNIRDMLRQAQDGEQLRQRLSNYFDRSVFRPLVYDLLSKPAPHLEWQQILGEAESKSESAQLLGQARRALESAPDNSALRFLSGISLAASDIPNPAQSAEDVLLGLATERRLRPEQNYATTSSVLHELRRNAPAQFEQVIGFMSSSTDVSVAGIIDAAEDVAIVALPSAQDAEVRQHCASAIARRLRRAQSDPQNSLCAVEEVLETLAANAAGHIDEAIRDILLDMRRGDGPQGKFSPAYTQFATSALVHVHDDELKQTCATPMLHELHCALLQVF